MARNFGGTTADKIQVANATPINITGTALSFAIWLRKADTGTRRYIFGKAGASASPFAYAARVDTSNLIVFLIDDGTGTFNVSTSTTTVSANTWYHVVGVKNGTGAGAIKIYINGVQEDSSTSNLSLASNTNDLLLGYQNVGATTEIWSGDLAEFAIWNAALDAAEAAALGKGFSPALVRPQSLAYYAPLIGRASPELDLKNGNGGTVTGTSASAHPRILNRTRGQVGIRPLRTGAAAVTQGADTASSAGTVAIAGAAAVTQGADTLVAAGAADSINGAADLTQGADTLSAAGTVALAGAAAVTQGADTLAAAGTVALVGAAAVTQGADTTSAAGAVAITGESALTQGADTLSATGGAPGLVGDASITQGADTLGAAGTVAIAGAAAVTQAANTLAAAGTVAIVGAATITQGADTLSAAGALGLIFRPRTRNSYTVRAAAAATIPAVGRRFTVPADSESEQL